MIQYTEYSALKRTRSITSCELVDLLFCRVTRPATKHKPSLKFQSSSSLTLITSASAWLGAILAVSYPEEGAIGPGCLCSQSWTLAGDQRYKLPVSDGVAPLTATEDNRQQDFYNDNKNTPAAPPTISTCLCSSI